MTLLGERGGPSLEVISGNRTGWRSFRVIGLEQRWQQWEYGTDSFKRHGCGIFYIVQYT